MYFLILFVEDARHSSKRLMKPLYERLYFYFPASKESNWVSVHLNSICNLHQPDIYRNVQLKLLSLKAKLFFPNATVTEKNLGIL